MPIIMILFLDIDECATGMHKCALNETCVNYIGDYDCEEPDELDVDEPVCPDGFRFDADNKLCNGMCILFRDVFKGLSLI